MLNVLVLTRWRPDDRSGGGALRSAQNIRALASLGSVDVVSVGIDDVKAPIDGIRDWTPFTLARPSVYERIRAKAWPLRPGAYPSVQCYDSRRVSRWLRRRIAGRRYDVAVIENIGLAPFLNDLKRAGCRVVFDAHNVESALHASVIAARSGQQRGLLQWVKDRVGHRRMKDVERRMLRGADVVWACSEADAVELARTYRPAAPIVVVPNGVDVESYGPAEVPSAASDWSRVPITLVYPGLFGYLPNEDAALSLITRVLPAVRAHGQRARLVLVGRNPTAAIMAAAHQQEGVEVTGAVESVLPYLQQPCVVTLPIRLGSGTRLKIVEAFAAGRPVVTTAKGVEGIEALDGQHLLIREDPLAMASAVVRLWSTPRLRAMLCDNALELVRRRYSWRAAEDCIARSLGLTPGAAPHSEDAVCQQVRVVPGEKAAAR